MGPFEVLAFVPMLIALAISIYILKLMSRFVTAVENIADRFQHKDES